MHNKFDATDLMYFNVSIWKFIKKTMSSVFLIIGRIGYRVMFAI
jgi:hypothetical protein